jgi:syntaxin 1B/2/3
MSNMQGNNNNNGYGGYRDAPAANGDMSAFWAEVTAVQELLKEYNDNVSHVSNLQQRSLNNIDDQQASQQLDQVAASNRKLSNELKQRIKALQAQGGDSRDGQTRRQQAGLLKEKFQAALQNYQQVEQRQRNASKNQMERQYKIVKPDASPEEVRAVVDDSGGQIFQQALLNSDQFGRSRAAYREVQERHNDILKITETMRELQQLMNDMAMMVEEQGETIQNVEQTTAIAEKDVETGYKHTETAKKSAMSARKKKWICFCICIVILIIIAVAIVAWLFTSGPLRPNVGGSNNNGNPAPVTVTAPAATRTGVSG